LAAKVTRGSDVVRVNRLWAQALDAGIRGENHEGALDADIAKNVIVERAQVTKGSSLASLFRPRGK
jgi:hypothetical protein